MMLDRFRKFGATGFARGMLMLLIVAFGAWGVEGFLQARQGSDALKVNGESISLLDIEQAYKARVKSLEQSLGAAATPEQLQGLGFAGQILNESVARTVLRQTANALHLNPATRQMQEEIAALPPFQNEKGEFDAARYRAGLAQLGRTPAQFEADMANDLAVRNLGSLLQLAPLPVNLAAAQAALANATTQLAVAALQTAPVTATPSADELKKFYDLNPKTYETPEYRSGVMLEISAETLSGTLSIPAEKIEAEYAANKEAYTLPETRVVRHILVPSMASATALQTSIKTLDEFAAAANQFSSDPGNMKTKGGELGSIKRDDVVPTFGDMAFSLAPNTLSAPVQSPFGWHLIWVESISPAHVQSLAEVKPAIEKALRESEAQDALGQLATQADDMIAGGATLAEVGKKLGMATRTLPRVPATDESLDAALKTALFGTAQGQTSTPLSLENGGVAYVQTTQIEAAATPSLEKIKDRVVADWRALQAELNAQRASEALLSAARAPATGQRSLQEAAVQAKVSGLTFSTLTVKGATQAPRWLQPRLLEIAAAAPGTTLPAALRDGNTWYVVQVQGRMPALPSTAAAAQTEANALTSDLRTDMEALLVAHLQSQAKVKCYPEGLKQVFGYEVNCQNQ